jgi:hypothetical protein
VSDVSFPGIAAAIGALILLASALGGACVESALALRARPRRWGARLAGPAATAVLGAALLVLVEEGPIEWRERADTWLAAIMLAGIAAWAILRVRLMRS